MIVNVFGAYGMNFVHCIWREVGRHFWGEIRL
jgi:hypothetical protein